MIHTGDTVMFRGDPQKEEFRVIMRNHDDTLEIEDGGVHFDWIPERLLEKVAPKLEPGQVWEHNTSNTPYFIVDVGADGVVTYTFPECHSPVRAEPSVFTKGNYSLVYPLGVGE